MERYQSKTVEIRRPVHEIYSKFTDIDALTPYLADKIEGWSATADTCTFRVQGFPISLRIGERIEDERITVVTQEGTPVHFTLSALFGKAPDDATSFSVALDIELNMMLRMMVGGKLQEGLDRMADGIAAALDR